MKLKPLKQWICDGCRKVIESVDDGMVEIFYDPKDENMVSDFRIIHTYASSPQDPRRGCYHSTADKVQYDMPLNQYVGADGMARLLTYLDIGPHRQRDYQGPKVTNIRKWVETFRRLHLPYYEEACLYRGEAFRDGLILDENEEQFCTETILKTVIDRYAK